MIYIAHWKNSIELVAPIEGHAHFPIEAVMVYSIIIVSNTKSRFYGIKSAKRVILAENNTAYRLLTKYEYIKYKEICEELNTAL